MIGLRKHLSSLASEQFERYNIQTYSEKGTVVPSKTLSSIDKLNEKSLIGPIEK